jgi:hypothetical protein
VPGFRDIMYPAYVETLPPEEIEDLIAFLESL